MYIYTHTCVYTYLCMNSVCMCIHIRPYIFIKIYAYIHTRTYIHTYIYIHTQAQVCRRFGGTLYTKAFNTQLNINGFQLLSISPTKAASNAP